MTTADLIRNARAKAGLSQADVARRLGTTQAAVAQLERPHSNPTIATLQRIVDATGRELRLSTRPRRPTVDEDQIARQMAMTPAERLTAFTAAYRNVRRLATSVERRT